MQLNMYKYRLYPSSQQKIRLLKVFNHSKFVYNTLLDLNNKIWLTRKFDFNSLVKDIKICHPEIGNEVHSQVLQNVSDRLSKAFQNFFRRVKGKSYKEKGFPRFKSRIQSITYPQSGFKFVNERKLFCSKIGNIPIILHRIPKGKINTLTIKVNKTNQWFAIFSCEMPDTIIKHPSTEKIGVDVGIERYLTDHNGELVTNPRFYIKSEKKLGRLQRQLSRKKKGSRNHTKARLNVARLHNKIANQRADFLHKMSHSIAIKYSIIDGEQLNIKNMLKNHHLAKHISDVAWGTFYNMLSYKAVTCGGQLIKNPKTRGSSHRCSQCGFYVEDMPLNKRIFTCPKCGFVAHRDLNASHNHLNDTVGLTGISTPVDIEPPQQISSVASSMDEAGTILDNI